ncbi:MAG: PaaI family thioesterase [Candidatus Auribacter fodinae]|uniref:PaaI family thioesterase n=1 Tax=Candidatus Auribacter fodinae TaxID=2093366 RepID=A0A3A4R0S2_9BACT|nr:MAG: PaaI family thioesterase [Candidatus Auribacter fodinae]
MHSKCFVCGKDNCSGLGIHYSLDENGDVKGSVLVDEKFQDGYRKCHRGIIIALLDSAMVHNLLQRGTAGLTVSIDVQFFKPVPLGIQLSIWSAIISVKKGLYTIEAKIFDDTEIYAISTGKFM